ncbi:hypothetical protein EPIR_0845 [Erwinia piriflorinigrans CFBP 5888]|uniref:Uncharacterized protein n=1 Tax=Erwinia piriflorinigrans CFBP 5888 TaxID=1161919 RepID=V5Z5B8_9GAMM|nr:hypothetical protein EPIR_0845 [Erwinia piriflorinigrans CFBP 5888]
MREVWVVVYFFIKNQYFSFFYQDDVIYDINLYCVEWLLAC